MYFWSYGFWKGYPCLLQNSPPQPRRWTVRETHRMTWHLSQGRIWTEVTGDVGDLANSVLETNSLKDSHQHELTPPADWVLLCHWGWFRAFKRHTGMNPESPCHRSIHSFVHSFHGSTSSNQFLERKSIGTNSDAEELTYTAHVGSQRNNTTELKQYWRAWAMCSWMKTISFFFFNSFRKLLICKLSLPGWHFRVDIAFSLLQKPNRFSWAWTLHHAIRTLERMFMEEK